MPVNVELWQNTVKEILFKDNAFLDHMKNVDEFVEGGAIVHIPQAGAASNVERNRSSTPATVVSRNDTDVLYALDEFSTDPVKLSDRERVELSYDKMASFIRQDTGNLMEVMAEWLIYNAGLNTLAGSKLLSTGAARPSTAPGSTGDRKKLTKEDFLKAHTLLNSQSVSKQNRHMLIDSQQLADLLEDNDFYNAYERTASRQDGTLPKLFGFNIHERATVLNLTAGAALKAPGAAGAATDTTGCLFWQKDMIERAIGTIRVFEDMNSPTYYGDIISFLVRAQARANREDNKGYGLIYLDAA